MTLRISTHSRALIMSGKLDDDEPSNLDRARFLLQRAVLNPYAGEAERAADATVAMALMDLTRLEYSIEQAAIAEEWAKHHGR